MYKDELLESALGSPLEWAVENSLGVNPTKSELYKKAQWPNKPLILAQLTVLN